MLTFSIYFSTIAIVIGTSRIRPQTEWMGDEWTEETGEQSVTRNSRYVENRILYNFVIIDEPWHSVLHCLESIELFL